MKFGKEYEARLGSGEFPKHWASFAIQYGALKKCIRQVREELQGLNREPDSLGLLMKSSKEESQAGSSERSVEEALQEPDNATDAQNFYPPTISFAVEEETSRPVSASLSSKTRKFLLEAPNTRNEELRDSAVSGYDLDRLDAPPNASSPGPSSSIDDAALVRRVDVSIDSDCSFFDRIRADLSKLKTLQESEQAQFTGRIVNLRRALGMATAHTRSIIGSHSDLGIWRELFELYIDFDIFFSTWERNRGVQSADEAGKRLEAFIQEVLKRGVKYNFRKKLSRETLENFLSLNKNIHLQLKFHELERTAMTKILKKFDKRTPVKTGNVLAATLKTSALTHSIAKAVCSAVSDQLLTLVPQLNDYLCPICCGITWRPVRLSCKHVFCIRCLIVMQRRKEKACPICREKTVMAADEDNVDKARAKFLQKFFPAEVKEKHSENIRLAGIDAYGEAYDSGKCSVM